MNNGTRYQPFKPNRNSIAMLHTKSTVKNDPALTGISISSTGETSILVEDANDTKRWIPLQFVKGYRLEYRGACWKIVP